MDDSSHSVYLGTTGSDRAAWEAFDGKIGDGKDCAGISLGLTRHLGCIDLDAEYAGRRIRCVRYHDH